MAETHVPVYIEFVDEPMLIGGAIIDGDNIFITLIEGEGADRVRRVMDEQVLGLSLGYQYRPTPYKKDT